MCTFHDRLRAIRLERGLTQQQLADAIGVTKSTMAKYDRGALEPNLTNVCRIADALNVSLDYLVYGKEPIETVLHNEQESIYGFCSLFVLYLVRAVLHFIAGYPARSRRAGFIFALCLGERVCPGGTAARSGANTVLCGFHSWSGLFVVSIGYTLTIRRK